MGACPSRAIVIDWRRKEVNLMDTMSREILELFSKRNCLTLSQLSAILGIDWMTLAEPINYLRKLSYLRFEPNHASLNDLASDSPISMDDPLVITFEGRAAMEQDGQNRRRVKYTEFRAWMTLAIALAAFIKSFFF